MSAGEPMANNRLYLYDPETHETFLLAVTVGEGWYVQAGGPMTQPYAERLYHDHFALRLNAWLTDRDYGAAWSNAQDTTTLQLCTEHDLPQEARQRDLQEHAAPEERA